jgi:ribose transport system substrate-binding protein
VSLFGGAGTVIGGLIGVLLLQVVQSGLVTVGVSANWQQIAVGLIMILAVGLDTARRRLALSGLHVESPETRSQTPSASGLGKIFGMTYRKRSAVVLLVVVTVLGAVGVRAHLNSRSTAPGVHASQDANKRLLWVQPLRDHPVCKLMQAGFLNRCKELGYTCEVVGNASATTLDVAATIPLAEAALSRDTFGAVGVFTLDTAIYPFVEKLAAEGLPVVTWHELPPPGTIKGLKAATGQDLAQVGKEAAVALGTRLGGEGVIALTQGSFNVEENAKAEAFRHFMAEHFPKITVLPPQLEGYEATAAKAKAISLLQGNGKITGVFSTTGNGAQTWAGAARTAGRSLVIIGMDYIRANLDLVKAGEVFGIVAQPLYEEGAKTADLAAALAQGKNVPYHNPLPARVITAAEVGQYYALLDKAGQ